MKELPSVSKLRRPSIQCLIGIASGKVHNSMEIQLESSKDWKKNVEILELWIVYSRTILSGLDELEHILAELPKDSEVEVKGLHQVTSNSSALNYLQEVENAAWDVEKHFILAIDVKVAKKLVELSYRKRRAYFHFIIPRFVSH